MTFGEDLGWGSSVEESQRIIDRFVELGGNFIDTANGYTKGHSEKIIVNRRFPPISIRPHSQGAA
jgi:aryl-alcohol dehydrogenase-like predicted oxidoreductase